MSLFVDTSVWSLAWRRDHASSAPEVSELERALKAGDSIYATGLVLQELLQGFSRPKAHKQIIEHFSALPLLVPDRHDHIQAADLRNACRKKGKQIGTIDALIAQLCVRHDLVILTTDKDFQQIATVVSLSVWTP
ncbi:MAG: PIN domain-containing protein [Gammaproteobacteria bacterium]